MEEKIKDPTIWLSAPESVLQHLGEKSPFEPLVSGPSWALPLPPFEEELTGSLSCQPSLPPLSSEASGSDLHQKIEEAISFYRRWGYCLATLDPLGLQKASLPEGLTLPFFSETEKEQILSKGRYQGSKVRVVLEHLNKTYSSYLALEAAHLSDFKEKQWLYTLFEEKGVFASDLTAQIQKQIFHGLVAAEGFEKFLGTKFSGAKRFGLEGLDSLVPTLIEGFKFAHTLGVEHVVMGMAHRGRLNIMSNVFQISFDWFLERFRGDPIAEEGSGDVKYHLGAETPFLTLLPNPSHLESVNPVVLGAVKARQENVSGGTQAILGVVVHGDASFVGQGVVTESLILSPLEGYNTGGTVHIILDNQVGFTANPSETRPFPYPCDLVKGLNIPILHVNADHPEAALQAFWGALSFRQEFGKDIVIHLMGYRRHGHNETDEPTFTQPLLYGVIESHPSVRDLYGQQLVAQNILSPDDALKIEQAFHEKLTAAFDASVPLGVSSFPSAPLDSRVVVKGPDEALIQTVGQGLIAIPPDFSLHPKLTRWMEQRGGMLKGDTPLDWSTAEALALGTLVHEGFSVRLSGQDCGRGTFTQRHAVLTDFKNENTYVPLQSLSQTARVSIVNSPLSEMGVLGFEFGFSQMASRTLTLWEAQFGDFSNGAQVIIDQYIVSSFTKWGIRSGLVLLLPHAYEGQGPEHSSARLERFLQLAAEDNIQVVNCSTPANYFHVLRRQAYQNAPKPLIIMTPKSLLRHKAATSSLEDFGSRNSFLPVIAEPTPTPKESSRIVICSGKVYYDLLAARTEAKVAVPLIRLEELYPFPEDALRQALTPYASPETLLVWAQEEASNNGAWTFLENRLKDLAKSLMCKDVVYAGRPAAASPATGHAFIHVREQETLVKKALGI